MIKKHSLKGAQSHGADVSDHSTDWSVLWWVNGGPKGLIQEEVQEDTQQTSQDPRKHGGAWVRRKCSSRQTEPHAKVQRSGR